MSDLHFDLHGMSVSISADDEDLRAFLKEHFESRTGGHQGADLSIRATWRWGDPADPPASMAGGSGFERVGRGLLLARSQDGAGRLRAVWTRVPDFPELKMSFELEGDPISRLKVEAACAYAPRGVGKKLEYLRPGRVDRKKNRLFFKLTYFMVYYPMSWHLERTRGWGLLHASAVTGPQRRAALLSGLGGVGKSTLGLSLLARPGSRLLSDNLLFHDEERVYSCPEPVRLDSLALEGMADAGVEPQRTGLPLTAHPKPTYRVGPDRRVDAAALSAVYFLRFAPNSGVERIDPSRAAEILLAGNDLARELKEYRSCSALLSWMAAERGGPPQAPRASLTRLLEPAACWIFRIGLGEKVPDTAARLAESIERQA